MAVWTKLCDEYPKEDKPVILRWKDVLFRCIREISEDGDQLICIDYKGKRGRSFEISLKTPFTTKEITWRYE